MAEARQIELQPIAVERAARPRPGGDRSKRSRGHAAPYRRVPQPEISLRRRPFTEQYGLGEDGPHIKRLIYGATFLFSNDYEEGLITQKTGWSHEEILERVAVRVITRGAKGSSVEIAGEPRVDVPIAREAARVDPTGVGDADPVGFRPGLAWELSLERCAQVGSLRERATRSRWSEHREYRFGDTFLARFDEAYGPGSSSRHRPASEQSPPPLTPLLLRARWLHDSGLPKASLGNARSSAT